MAVKFQDYYQTLGVSRTASKDEIRKAFRKLARQYHPDVSKAPGAEEKFRQVNEAYEVLGDPDKRKRYDELGENWKEGQEFRPPPGFENMHFNFGRGTAGRRGQGATFSFDTSGGGGGGFSDFFEALFGGIGGQTMRSGGTSGGGASGGGGVFEHLRQAHGRSRPAQPQHPTHAEAVLDISLEEAFHGSTRSLDLQGPDGRKRIDVKVPAGIHNDAKVRLKDEGVLLHVRITPHPRYELSQDGRDLTVDLPVTPPEAALGAKVTLQTLDGDVTLTVPPGSSSGSRLRLTGKGMPDRQSPKKRGDLYARLRIVMPKTLSDEEKKLYDKLADISGHDPRKES
ncbi:MAG: DnaJ domain-containing protein [Phycisphaera sp.]|nr:DnaJ domain-containing protein [Phycisphaera sp.]